jgi:hypothetical protein
VSHSFQENRMNKVNRLITASLLLGWCTVAGATDAGKRSDANASCRQETKRVAVWPHGSPKAPAMPRFEKREVTVCDAQVARQAAKGK